MTDGEDMVEVIRWIPEVVRVEVLEEETVVRVRFLASRAMRAVVEQTALRVWYRYARHEGRGALVVSHRWRKRRVG